MTARSNLMPRFLALNTASVMSGPITTSTPTRMNSSSLPPAAWNNGPGYHAASMRASPAAAMNTLMRRWIPEARQRDMGFSAYYRNMRLALILVFCLLGGAAAAQGYPNRAVRVLVGFPPG